jgi:hypothetical protein
MMPKPQLQQAMRPRERRHVTIVAGFKCHEGLVLCADTQETVNQLSKRNVPKLIFQPSAYVVQTKEIHTDEMAVSFCGAADNGPFVDKLVENAWEDAQMGSSLDEACLLIEGSIKKTYREYGQIFQTGYCPSADLIYGVKMFGSSRLFSASGPIVNERNTFYSGGAGYYMADFLASRMYTRHLSLRQCAILAAYILFQAKEHVDGCGGESQIAVMRNEGVSGNANAASVERLNRLFSKFDSAVGGLILNATDLEIEDRHLLGSIESLHDYMVKCRADEQPNYKRFSQLRAFGQLLGVDAMYPEGRIDEFGLPLPKEPND